MSIRHEARGGLADQTLTHQDRIVSPGMSHIDQAKGVADLVLGKHTWLTYKVVYGQANEWEVRVEAVAFDYFGCVIAYVGKNPTNLSVELYGLVEQMQYSLLSGRAPFRKGYPLSFTEAE